MSETTEEDKIQKTLRLIPDTIREAVSKILIPIWIGLILGVVSAGYTFLPIVWQDCQRQGIEKWLPRDWITITLCLIAIFALFFYLGVKYGRKRKREKIRWITYKNLHWRGHEKEFPEVEGRPFCPEHDLELVIENGKLTCPQCGESKFESLKLEETRDWFLGAKSLLRGFMDKKIKL